MKTEIKILLVQDHGLDDGWVIQTLTQAGYEPAYQVVSTPDVMTAALENQNWDIAIIVPEAVAAGDLVAAIDTAGEPLVESAEIFDIFRGDAIGADHKSVAISLTYRSPEQTLDDSVVNTVHQRLIKMLEERFQGRLRDAG